MNNIENNNINDINDIEDINIINDVNYINSIDKINYENISDKLSINNDFLAINSMKYYDISSSINDSEKDYESIFTNVENNTINDLIFLKKMIYLRDIINQYIILAVYMLKDILFGEKNRKKIINNLII